MRLVWLTYGIPWPTDSGQRIRDEALIRRLCQRGVEIHLVCLAKDEVVIPDLAPLESMCASVTVFRPPPRGVLAEARHFLRCRAMNLPLAMHSFYFPELAKIVSERVAVHDAHLLQLEHSFLSGYIAAASAKGVRTVLSLHNLGWLQYARMARLPAPAGARFIAHVKAWLMRNWEARWARRFDLCLTVSATEARLLAGEVSASRIAVIENGVDCSRFTPLPRPAGFDILFTGVMSYPPNADAVEFFCQEILPRIRAVVPQARLLVVGHSPPERIRRLAGPEVIVTGSVDDLLPYYRDCRVCVAPLRAGGGTRLKILEAMALGRPVVSTAVGCEGIEATPDSEILVADTADDFARAVLRLLQDDALWDTLSRQARMKVELSYNWDMLAGRLHASYLDLFGGRIQPDRGTPSC